MRIDLVAHIVAGAVGILAGYVALSVTKGSDVHRRSGMVFVYAMVAMGFLGSMMAALRQVAPGANVPVGILTVYLVITGLTTVRPPEVQARGLDLGLMVVAVATTVALSAFGFAAMASPKGKLYGMPPYPFFVFGAIGLLAVAGDLRVLRTGGVRVLQRTPRLVRHLWRMNVALLIAAFSFFIGQAKVIPKPYRIFPLLLIPPLVVLASLLYWLWRVRVRQSVLGIVRVSERRVASSWR